MPKGMNEQYKIDATGENLSSKNISRKSEGRPSVASATQTVDRPLRGKTSEAVGSDSLPGFVRKNKGMFERTEGRI